MHMTPGHPGCMSRVDFVTVSSDLQVYLLDTWVKRGTELSTYHHLVASWTNLACLNIYAPLLV